MPVGRDPTSLGGGWGLGRGKEREQLLGHDLGNPKASLSGLVAKVSLVLCQKVPRELFRVKQRQFVELRGL